MNSESERTTIEIPKQLSQTRNEHHTHYLLMLGERYGEYEADHNFMMKIDDDLGSEEKQLHFMGREWRGGCSDSWDSNMGGYWFDGNMSYIPAVCGYLTPEEVEVYSNVVSTCYVHDTTPLSHSEYPEPCKTCGAEYDDEGDDGECDSCLDKGYNKEKKDDE